MISYETVKSNKDIRTYIKKADASLNAIGYTEHSYAHVTKVAETAGEILEKTGHSEHEAELARNAGFMHDIGNLVNRSEHSQSGAVMAFRILDNLDMPAEDVATVVTAIGNHDEGTGIPVDAVSAALILADKTDVRRSRVRNAEEISIDIHDRVNYSVTGSKLDIDNESMSITLVLDIDTTLGSVMDYFEIFLGRMLMCRKAAEKLGYNFKLIINNQPLI